MQFSSTPSETEHHLLQGFFITLKGVVSPLSEMPVFSSHLGVPIGVNERTPLKIPDSSF